MLQFLILSFFFKNFLYFILIRINIGALRERKLMLFEFHWSVELFKKARA